MFDKLKQIKQLKEMQGAAQAEKFEGEQKGVRVTVNGTFQVESVSIEAELDKAELEAAIREAVNDATRKAQMAMAQKFSGMMQ